MSLSENQESRKQRSQSIASNSSSKRTRPVLSDPDDFIIYSSEEAEHIAYAIKEAFAIDIASEVVLAAANTRKLARKIVEARGLLHTSRAQPDPLPHIGT